MPARLARACRVGSCPLPVVGGGRCASHGGAAAPGYRRWGTRPDPPARLRGRANQERRKRLFARRPLCQSCLDARPSRTTIATIADHAIPLAEGGADDISNLVPTCADCHKVKVQQEAARGLKRAR